MFAEKLVQSLTFWHLKLLSNFSAFYRGMYSACSFEARRIVLFWILFRGGATEGTGGNSPPTPRKGHFCKSSKTDAKLFEVLGGVTLPTILKFQPELSQVVFKDRI